MNPRIASVKPAADYVLELLFTNGEHGRYDCRPLLDFGVFAELKDWTAFCEVRMEYGTVTWPGGQDICPDTLYLDSSRSSATSSEEEESLK